MIATGSHINDLMYDYYNTLNSRDAGQRHYGPIQLASGLSEVATGSEHVFPYPEKTLYSTVYYVANAPLSAGTIALEIAFMSGFTGTWHALETKQFSGGTSAGVSVSLFNSGPYIVMRPRVTGAIVGGTVDIYYLGS